ncbi:MAG: DUF2813 domain-containing protein [Spirochaetes bacterium]|nr:DUF2813 domain-containing protein [Spirochaetota bacterium]MBN2770828.1 DUF2813 domain-containing protein [Spirochaetota bacterium]
MKISKLHIKNYRGFIEETILLDDVTVFVGENNSGKSTILDALQLAIGSQNHKKLSRYDFHLENPQSVTGDAGNVEIQVDLSEQSEDEWPDEIQQTLAESMDIDSNGLRSFYLNFTGEYSETEDECKSSREFVSKAGSVKGKNANTLKAFYEFKNFLPLFYISSLRDITKEFKQKKGLFNRFIASQKMDKEKRKEFEDKLSSLNEEILGILTNISDLKDHLKKSMNVLTGSAESKTDIEPLSTDIYELIENAEVIIESKTGIKLPLEKHGSGAHSLSILFLYEAFLTVLLATEYDSFSEPVLLIEEPEAHLHPSAVRLFWQFLKQMPGQKIVTTHSGDIISSVPYQNIRRIVGVEGINRVKRMSPLSGLEDRYLKNFITYSRGELFFAHCWLIVEGETEHIFFDNLLNSNGFLDSKGIRIFQFPNMDISVILDIAKQLCIKWFFVSDGDTEGQKYTVKAKQVLNNPVDEDKYIYTIPEKTIEVHLMKYGFPDVYESKLSNQTIGNVSGAKGTESYYESVYKAIKKSISKPQVVLEVVEKIQTGVPEPPLLTEVRQKLEAL